MSISNSVSALRVNTPPIHGEVRPLVLIVDDERINRELLRGTLQRHGYDVLMAENGEQALTLMEVKTPNLVLLDVVMQPMNGFEVLQRIRERHRDVELPVIMVTADTDRDTIIYAFRGGANDYLTKPFDPEVILARVSLHLRLRAAQAELERSQERYLMAAEGSRIGLWDWDVEQRQIFLSTRWKEMLGFAEHELPSEINSWLERIHPQDRPQFLALLSLRQPGQQSRFECELRMLHRDNTYRWMQCAGVVQADTSGQPRRLAGSLADITEGKVRDVLTGLPNRLLFEERVEQAIQFSREQATLSAVLFLDLDKFKLVNDSLGHDAGDLLLCSVARRLEKILRYEFGNPERSGGEISRHGGDEFTVLLTYMPSRETVESVASRIIASLSEPFHLGQHEVSIGVSIGIAYVRPHMTGPMEAIHEADTAMYYAKTSGRGNFRVYDPEMQTSAAARLALENDVRHALKSGEFYPVYQPIVSLQTGKVDGFEALCRWRHPRGETVGPEVFIPVVESLGLIGQLSAQILQMVGPQIRLWNTQIQRTKPLTVTINCSTREFAQPYFVRNLLERIDALGLEHKTIRLEVTESTLLENAEAARHIISELRSLGIGVGLDDFGTGYSSLSYLHRLPLDLLKIDKSFVRQMQRGNESYEIVRTILSLAAGLGLNVVAEGVETWEQHALLEELGCSHAQGFLYFRPLTTEGVEQLLLENHPLFEPSPALAATAEFILSAEELTELQSLQQAPQN